MPGKKGRKIGRNKDTCLEYKKEGRTAKNKALKQAKHLRSHPADTAPKASVNYTRKKPLNYFEKTLDKVKHM